jgi:hypothetical protein
MKSLIILFLTLVLYSIAAFSQDEGKDASFGLIPQDMLGTWEIVKYSYEETSDKMAITPSSYIKKQISFFPESVDILGQDCSFEAVNKWHSIDDLTFDPYGKWSNYIPEDRVYDVYSYIREDMQIFRRRHSSGEDNVHTLHLDIYCKQKYNDITDPEILKFISLEGGIPDYQINLSFTYYKENPNFLIFTHPGDYSYDYPAITFALKRKETSDRE